MTRVWRTGHPVDLAERLLFTASGAFALRFGGYPADIGRRVFDDGSVVMWLMAGRLLSPPRDHWRKVIPTLAADWIRISDGLLPETVVVACGPARESAYVVVIGPPKRGELPN